MRVYENETPQQLKQRLWRSAEVQHYIYASILTLVLALLYCGLAWLGHTDSAASGLLCQGTVLVFLLYCGPTLVFNGYRLTAIFCKWEQYSYFRVRLSNQHSSYWLGTTRFAVVLEEKDGSKQVVNTHYLFTPRGLTNPSLDDYAGKTAVVGFNEETDQVVFLG